MKNIERCATFFGQRNCIVHSWFTVPGHSAYNEKVLGYMHRCLFWRSGSAEAINHATPCPREYSNIPLPPEKAPAYRRFILRQLGRSSSRIHRLPLPPRKGCCLFGSLLIFVYH